MLKFQASSKNKLKLIQIPNKYMNTKIDFREKLVFIQNQIDKDGPKPEEYAQMNEWYFVVWQAFENGDFTLEQIQQLRDVLQPVYTDTDAMFGLVYLGPYGYKGDFEIIDKIYQNTFSDIEHIQNWDKYFQSTAATNAVRNRKQYFKKILEQKARANPDLQVLNLASGPCRDLKEFDEEYDLKNVAFDCVEFDERAIAYAKEILNPNQKVNFIKQNIFKFSTDKKYDLVWSAGLFDYFDDKTFTGILGRVLNFTNDTGEIIIGNFHPSNPTKNCMEFTAWQLYHRDENKLIELAKNAGVADTTNISIEAESEGVNLFMRIR